MSDLLSFMSNTDKLEFSSLWKWISCFNDVMNHVDYIIKHDVYPQKCILVLKISVVYQNDISWVILLGYSRS